MALTMREFDEHDPSTWGVLNLPDGYEWRDFDSEMGEEHLYAPDGRDLTLAYDATRALAAEDDTMPCGCSAGSCYCGCPCGAENCGA